MTTSAADQTTDEFAGRLIESTVAAMDLLSIYIGDRLGWYAALADQGPLDSTRLAMLTDTDERYAREWLEQQATGGILVAEDPGTDSRSRSYRLPPAAAEALTHIKSTAFVAPMARMFAASAHQLPALLDAYRTGGGVSWEQLGDDGRESQADVNRPLFESALAAALASVSDVHDVLARDGANVADVGCGFGWSTLAIARAYPAARVIGFDVDAPSIEAARANAADAGLADRVSFEQLGGEDVPQHGPFNAAFIFEALHDMPYPVPVLDALRRAVEPDGAVVVMDEAVNDAFMPEGDIVDRLMYGYSLFVCLPDSMSAPDSAATGTVMRRPVLERYAREAGFSGVDVLDVGEFGFFRFYRLRH